MVQKKKRFHALSRLKHHAIMNVPLSLFPFPTTPPIFLPPKNPTYTHNLGKGQCNSTHDNQVFALYKLINDVS